MPHHLNVTSEIGRLRKVIVHSPGPELLAVTPSNRKEFLYDDIIDLDGAAEEHRRFTAILGRFAQTLEVTDLLTETLAIPEAREFLLRRSEEVTADHDLGPSMLTLSPEALVTHYVQGWSSDPGPFARHLDQQLYGLPPLPNLFFTRDASVVIGNSVAISSMRFQSRWAEEALMRTIFGFHPELRTEQFLYDGSDERRYDYVIEGGDIHPLRQDLVMVGVSPRTSVAAVDYLTESLFSRTEVTDVLVVVLPDRGTAIHLDMVWTQVDRELCVAYPPTFRGPQRAPILHRRRGEMIVREPATLFDALGDVGMPMEPIWAGGANRNAQEREQWGSGCNFLALAPGQVVSYERNDGTLRGLEAAGFQIIGGESLLLGDDEVVAGTRAAITFSGAELVRGGGGPRCMTCPVLRDDL